VGATCYARSFIGVIRQVARLPLLTLCRSVHFRCWRSTGRVAAVPALPVPVSPIVGPGFTGLPSRSPAKHLLLGCICVRLRCILCAALSLAGTRRFVPDSLLEEAGFELSVPPAGAGLFRR
jgi:hypothetical protein